MIRYVLLGLGIGGLYTLAALGIVAIHRGSKVLNLAHGAVAMWGAYLFVDFRDNHGWNAWFAVAATLAIAGVFGAAAYLIVIRPIRSATPLVKMVATIGLLGVLQALAIERYGPATSLVPSSLPITPHHIFGAFISEDRLWLLAIAVGVTALMSVWSARSRIALATRAMTEHERAATALGYSPHVLGVVNWAIGCMLAALAGLLLAPLTGLGPLGISIIIVPSLSASLVGRFDSYWGALAGGMILGVGQSLVTEHVSAPGWDSAVPVFLVILVLLLRRRGDARLEHNVAIPVSSGRFNPYFVGAGLLLVVALIMRGTNEWVDATTLSICFGILALSLVVLIGYTNQISLAQMAIAGIGALVAGRISVDYGLPFEIAPLVGAAVGAAVGFVVGLPALRVRGYNLAVVTLGLSLATERVLFQNPKYTGGLNGFQPERPSIFGIDVNAVTHGAGYAYVCLFWLAVSVLVVWFVRRSRIGRRLLAMRTNERAAAAEGVSVARTKLIGFTLASALAGMAGVLLAFRQTPIDFTSFSFFDSINLVTTAVIGGVGAIAGGVIAGFLTIGGVAFRGIGKLNLTWLEDHYALVFGAGVILAVQFQPNGIASLFGRKRPDPARIPEGVVAPREPQLLSARDVVVTFGGVQAVDHARIEVPPGIVVGLIGPNGAGKSTFLDAIGGFARPSSGEVYLGETNLTRVRPYRRAREGIGRVFQSVELFEDITVAQNLLVAAESAGSGNGRLPPAARDLLERFGLTEALTRSPGELSMANRRLIGVARALAGNPSVLLLDEPGAGLSMTESLALGEEVRRLAVESGLGILIVDHDMGLVMAACDHIVVLRDGAVLAEGTPEEVSNDAAVRAAYLGETVALTDAAEKVVAAAREAERVEKV